MARKTRKTTGKRKSAMSIPELRRSFESIEAVGRRLAAQVHAKKMSKSAAVTAYGKEWKRIFGRPFPQKNALAAIEHAMSVGKQRGGGELQPGSLTMSGSMTGGGDSTPAPVSWSGLQPGVYSAPALPGVTTPAGYQANGSFLPYVEKGFEVGIPADGLASMCGKQDSFPMPAAQLGSNAVTPAGATPIGSTTYMKGGSVSSSTGDQMPLRGGRRRSNRNTRKGLNRRRMRGGAASLAMAFRPLDSSNPSGVLYDQVTNFKGLPPPASPDPTQPAFNYQAGNIKVPEFGNAGAINREIPKTDVTSIPPTASGTA